LTTKAGEHHPDFPELISEGEESDREPNSDEDQHETNNSRLKCSRCGSTKMIHSATIVDQGDSSDGTLKVMVQGVAYALFFTDRAFGEIKPDICGDCGHIDFRVANPRELYEQEQKAIEQRALHAEPLDGMDPGSWTA
jgi:hypothetical protein